MQAQGGRTTKRIGHYDVNVRGKGRQFRNDVLESMSHCHGLVPLFVYGPVVLFALYWLFAETAIAPLAGVGYVAAGVTFWTFFEYWMHREVFHFRRLPKLHYFIHGIHHEYPNDKGRLVMPPGASLFIAIPMWFAMQAIFGTDVAVGLYAGFVGGYLWYDETHFWTHVDKPRTRLGRLLRSHHMKHHFATPDQRFGVSTPLWDWVFRTLPRDGREPSGPGGGAQGDALDVREG